MKKACMFLVLVFTQVYCDDYLNVHLSSGYEHVNVDDISKITFGSDGSEINFVLSSGNTSSKIIDDIKKMLFGTSAAGDASLPVELVSFAAVRENKDTFLTWKTASEIENFGFEIERIHSGMDAWEMIGFVEGNGSIATASDYSFTDKYSRQLTRLKYRLKQIDLCGSFEYSREIAITSGDIMLPEISRLYNYPNPFNPITTLCYDLNSANSVRLALYDIQGREVTALVNQLQSPGHYEVTFDGYAFDSGMYLCRLSSETESKIIKMLLIK